MVLAVCRKTNLVDFRKITVTELFHIIFLLVNNLSNHNDFGKLEILFSQIIAMNSKTKVIIIVYLQSKIRFRLSIRPLQVLVKL